MNSKGNRDLPIESEQEDLFGLQDYYRGLADFIDRCETPFTIALQGDWGSGKTSMMNNVAARLKKHAVIRFNTWQYAQFSGESDLPAALLSAITKKVREQLGAADKAGDGLKRALEGILSGKRFSLSAGLPGIVTLSYGADKGEKESGTFYEGIESFHREFEKAVAALRKKDAGGERKVIIFIDDLDRLHPARAVELLEIIKLFLDVEGCVFVLALDYDVVILGVEQKYGDQLMFQKGKSFFDKMIQLPFQIPVNFYKMDLLLEHAFERMGIVVEENAQFVKLIQRSVGSNPRTVKRLLNSFELLVDILKLKEQAGREHGQEYLYLLFILILQLYDEHFYRYLIRNRSWTDTSGGAETIFSFREGQDGPTYEKFLLEEMVEDNERQESFPLKRTGMLVGVLNELLGADSIAREANIELFESLLQESQVTSSGAAEQGSSGMVELRPDTELKDLVIQGLLIEGRGEAAANTFQDVFIQTVERLIGKEAFVSFAGDRKRTKKADIPDRMFLELDSREGETRDVSYHPSSVKEIHGMPIVLHYGREDLKKYLFRLLEAFRIQNKIFLRVVERE